jgi:hypothetical protein
MGGKPGQTIGGGRERRGVSSPLHPHHWLGELTTWRGARVGADRWVGVGARTRGTGASTCVLNSLVPLTRRLVRRRAAQTSGGFVLCRVCAFTIAVVASFLGRPLQEDRSAKKEPCFSTSSAITCSRLELVPQGELHHARVREQAAKLAKIRACVNCSCNCLDIEAR